MSAAGLGPNMRTLPRRAKASLWEDRGSCLLFTFLSTPKTAWQQGPNKSLLQLWF